MQIHRLNHLLFIVYVVLGLCLEDTRVDKLQCPLVIAAARIGSLIEASDRAFRILRSQMALLVASEVAMNSASRVERAVAD